MNGAEQSWSSKAGAAKLEQQSWSSKAGAAKLGMLSVLES
jgi:hypothetical protein